MRFFGERGLALSELLVLAAAGSLALTATAAITMPEMSGHRRSAAYDVQTFAQLARIESIRRARPQRLVIAPHGVLGIYDTGGIGDEGDGLPLYHKQLPSRTSFASPDGQGVAIALPAVESGFEVVFAPDGDLVRGHGSVSLKERGTFHKLSFLVGGDTRIERWDGMLWVPVD